jgi:trk system potassium uptake protein TrkH
MGAANFGLHYSFITRGNIFRYFYDLEFRSLLIIIMLVSFLVAAFLIHYKVTRLPTQAINQAIFSVVSIATTTGFINTRFDLWPGFVPFIIMLTALIGGSAGSTAGGIKIIRALLFFKQGAHELKLLVHPKAVFSMRLGKQVIAPNIIQATWGFFSVFFSFFILEFLLLMAFGMDVTSAIGASIATLSNVGASIGSVALSFNDISTPCKWICIVAMIAGRLEIFTLLVLLTPSFWRK